MKPGGQESQGRPWAMSQGTDVVAGTQERKGRGREKGGAKNAQKVLSL